MTEANWARAMAAALVAQHRAEMVRAREADRARPIGTLSIDLGRADYRRVTELSIDAKDWAVWVWRWDGTHWARHKRLTSGRGIALSEAFDAMRRHADRLGLERKP